MGFSWSDRDDCMSEEEERAADMRALEAETDDWLHDWSDDFNSDEYLASVEAA